MIDLRSDTGTLPTDEMREVMKNAVVGDDGRGTDPTVAKLEELSAEIFGKEAALFCNSGTMANIVAVLTHVKRGERIGIDPNSHIYSSETSIFMEDYFGRKAEFYRANSMGRPEMSDVRNLIERRQIQLLCFENTLGFYGGTCLTAEELADYCFEAQKHNIPVHLDGARIFNAAVHLNEKVSELTKSVDTVMYCLSKGLGAPVGSVLCGSKEFITQARKTRKALGGNMRQSGIVAAAGIIALQDADRLKDDHSHAQMLFKAIAHNPLIRINDASIQTNIIKIDISTSGMNLREFVNGLKKEGVLVKEVDGQHIRLVLHKDISTVHVGEAADSINRFLK
ncbi:threonine aldolase family protein [Sporosarcina siberiensis]|uniref:Threonine aldolase family protein n=1 Tax=Sporosarcina siberiensis TaxID=1365606 RepID=A0ABW4SEF1_9BACL